MRSPFAFTHDLVDDPRLQLDAIIELARRLSPRRLEVSEESADVIAGFDYDQIYRDDDPGEVIRSVAGTARSAFIQNIEADPPYRELVEQIVHAGIGPFGIGPQDIIGYEGYMFVAGGHAVTSAHVDHEYNFLMVLSGLKRVFLAPVGDHQGELALEAMYSGRFGTCGSAPAEMVEFVLGPGQGVFIPPRAAHYVENGAEGGTAISAVFRTEALEAQRSVYRWNAKLRRLGLDPTPPECSAWRDGLKHGSLQLLSRAQKLRGRTRQPASATR